MISNWFLLLLRCIRNLNPFPILSDAQQRYNKYLPHFLTNLIFLVCTVSYKSSSFSLDLWPGHFMLEPWINGGRTWPITYSTLSLMLFVNDKRSSILYNCYAVWLGVCFRGGQVSRVENQRGSILPDRYEVGSLLPNGSRIICYSSGNLVYWVVWCRSRD